MARGHSVRGLVRRGSEKHLAPGCEGVTGDPLDAPTYQKFVAGNDTLVHLVGVAHPSPAKKQPFRTIDLPSATQAIAAAASGGVRHMVYVSVAQPAPVMRDYIAARAEAEEAIRQARVNATILRPDCAGLPAAGSAARDARIGAAAGAGERGADDRGHGTGN